MSHTETPFPIVCCPPCFAGQCAKCVQFVDTIDECECQGAFHERVRLEFQCDTKVVSLQVRKDAHA